MIIKQIGNQTRLELRRQYEPWPYGLASRCLILYTTGHNLQLRRLYYLNFMDNPTTLMVICPSFCWIGYRPLLPTIFSKTWRSFRGFSENILTLPKRAFAKAKAEGYLLLTYPQLRRPGIGFVNSHQVSEILGHIPLGTYVFQLQLLRTIGTWELLILFRINIPARQILKNPLQKRKIRSCFANWPKQNFWQQISKIFGNNCRREAISIRLINMATNWLPQRIDERLLLLWCSD